MYSQPESGQHHTLVGCDLNLYATNVFMTSQSPYASTDEALTDVLRLSRAMTYKATMA